MHVRTIVAIVVMAAAICVIAQASAATSVADFAGLPLLRPAGDGQSDLFFAHNKCSNYVVEPGF